MKTWSDFFAWCKQNKRKPNDGAALVEFVRGDAK